MGKVDKSKIEVEALYNLEFSDRKRRLVREIHRNERGRSERRHVSAGGKYLPSRGRIGRKPSRAGRQGGSGGGSSKSWRSPGYTCTYEKIDVRRMAIMRTERPHGLHFFWILGPKRIYETLITTADAVSITGSVRTRRPRPRRVPQNYHRKRRAAGGGFYSPLYA